MGGLDPRALMGGSLSLAAIILTPFAALDTPGRAPSLGAWAAVITLALACTALAFVVFTVLIREAGTSRAMVITYVNPVVALALGVTLESERPGAGAILGLLLILAGSWLSTTGRIGRGGSGSHGPVEAAASRTKSRTDEELRGRGPADRLLD
jgi:drug/metabolite transporter (DMT)-like permease